MALVRVGESAMFGGPPAVYLYFLKHFITAEFVHRTGSVEAQLVSRWVPYGPMSLGHSTDSKLSVYL